jgi:REP element-mobilizing transposase RayT
MAATCRDLGCTPLAIGGIDNHVHMLLRFSSKIAIAQLVGEIKGVSSHAVTHAIRRDHFFKWQGSYGAFTLSQRSVSQVCGYIQHQKRHHAEKTLINALEIAPIQMICQASDP